MNAAQPSQWSEWLIAGKCGDVQSYHFFLEAITPYLRRIIGEIYAPLKFHDTNEKLLQEILRAVHLKRVTWDRHTDINLWLMAIVHHKLNHDLRGRGISSAIRHKVLPKLEPGERTVLPARSRESHDTSFDDGLLRVLLPFGLRYNFRGLFRLSRRK